MRGTGYEAVVLHRQCPVTKQPTHPTQQRWLAPRVKNADILFGILHGYEQIKIIQPISRKMLITRGYYLNCILVSAVFMNNSG